MLKFKSTALRMGKAVRHRGPDWSGNHVAKNTILVHERLSIVGVDTGAQPLLSEDGTIALAVNGEIYNHKILRQHHLKKPYAFKTHSDCEIIIPLVKRFVDEIAARTDGKSSISSMALMPQSILTACSLGCCMTRHRTE